MVTTFIVSSDIMGSGSRELGEKILGSFLRKVAGHANRANIIFYNSGVQLLAKPSPFLADLSLLAEKGVELIACGTCVNFFGLNDRIEIGRVSTMDEILSTIASSEKVVSI